MAFVGEITGDGRVVLLEDDHEATSSSSQTDQDATYTSPVHPVDMPLEHVLSKMPPKVFTSDRTVDAS